jgi:Chaperone of endosialidase
MSNLTIRSISRTKATLDGSESFEGEDATGSFQAPTSAFNGQFLPLTGGALSGALTVGLNSASAAAPLTSTLYGSGSIFGIQASGGTSAAPTAIGTSWNYATLGFNGYNGSAFATGAAIVAGSQGGWSATNNGAELLFFNAPVNGTGYWSDRTFGITQDGTVYVNGNGPLALSATGGFFAIPNMAGAPTGTPNYTSGLKAISGTTPLVYDTTDNLLYAYNGAWRASATLGQAASFSNVTVNGAAGTTRYMGAQTGGLNRWTWGAETTAEGGSNAGSNFSLIGYNDAGATLNTPLSINRATGLVTLNNGLTVVNGLRLNGSTAHGVAIAQGNNVAITSTAAGGANLPLVGQGAADPIFTALSLTAGVTGTLPVANGGTGVTTSTGSGANVLGTAPALSAPTVTGGLSTDTLTASGIVSGGALQPTGATLPANGIYLPAANTLSFATNSLLRWSINANGQLNNQNAASAAGLTVYGASGAANSLGAGGNLAGTAGNAVSIWGSATNGGACQIATSYFTTDGPLQIGTMTTPGALTIAVNGQVTTANGQVVQGPAVTKLWIDGATGSNRYLTFSTAGTNRWNVGATNTAEGGSNTGTDFRIQALSDVGAAVATPLTITRSTGLITIANGLTVTGGVTADTVNVNGTTIPTNGGIYLPAANTLGFASFGARRWSINANGQLSNVSAASAAGFAVFGASGAASALAVGGNLAGTGGNSVNIYGSTTDGGACQIMTNYFTTDGVLRIGTFTTPSAMSIAVNGVVTFAQPIVNGSDRRLKSNIEPVDKALAAVEKLQGVFFQTEGLDRRQVGLVAQDVRKVLPEVVFEDTDEEKTLGIAYAPIVAVLVEAVKELSAKVTMLEAAAAVRGG